MRYTASARSAHVTFVSVIGPAASDAALEGYVLWRFCLLELPYKSFKMFRQVGIDDIMVQAAKRMAEEEDDLLLGKVQTIRDVSRPIPIVFLMHGVALSALPFITLD